MQPAPAAKKSKTETSSEGEGTTQVGEVNIATDALANLNISASLVPTVPESVAAKGQGVQPGTVAVATLTEKKKSREACLVRQRIKQARSDQENIAAQLCYLEKVKGMSAGGKYKIKLTPPAPDMSEMPAGPALTQAPPMGPGGPSGPGGDPTMGGDPTGGGTPTGPGGDPTGGGMPTGGDAPSMELELSVFLDNSDPAKFKIFMCDAGKLTQKIVIDGAKATGSKGSYVVSSKNDMGNLAIVGAFDNGVGAAGRQRATSQGASSMKQGDTDMKFRSNMYLDLNPEGVSEIKSAFEMSQSGDFSMSDKELATALIGPNLGSALFQHTVDGDDMFFPPQQMALANTATIETSRAFFDNGGYALAQTDSDSFKAGGVLEVKESMFPKLPPLDFDAKFDAGDWECSDAVTLDYTVPEADYKACDDKFKAAFVSEKCEADTYAPGVSAPEVPALVDQRDSFDPAEFTPPEGELPPAGDVPQAE